MRKINILIALIMLMSICDNGYPQVNSYNVNLFPNQDLGTGLDPDKGYEIWMAARTDTTAIVFPTHFVRVGFFSHDSLVAIYGSTPTSILQLIDIFPSNEDGGWLKAAGFAIDYSGNKSLSAAFSAWFHKDDRTPPVAMNFAGVGISK